MRPRLLPHRRRCEYTGVAGPAVTCPKTPEQAARVRDCLAQAEQSGNRDLASYYQHQLDRYDRSAS